MWGEGTLSRGGVTGTFHADREKRQSWGRKQSEWVTKHLHQVHHLQRNNPEARNKGEINRGFFSGKCFHEIKIWTTWENKRTCLVASGEIEYEGK